MQYKYKISLVMPVYNSALYLGEAIESIINQSLGFDNIQLIIVNDGSTDNSAEIIKAYAQKHSNIVFVEKENGGVASARNKGLEYVDGKYVSFPDPDDTLSLNAYKDVIEFFEENYDKTDVVSFPIYFFGDREGAHPLNNKFEAGNRIINLEEEELFQLHITSSVIKSELAGSIHFKSELVTSEDAEALLRILVNSPRLGVVCSARYNYRKHASSLIGSAQSKRGWYTEHLKHYFNSILDIAEQRYGKAPRFIQRAMMYDLSWKLSVKHAPNGLSSADVDEFLTELYACVSRLDDGIIMEANVPKATKFQLLAKKHGDSYVISDDDISLSNGMPCLSMCPYTLEFVEDCVDKIKINARLITPEAMPKIDGGVLYVNGHAVPSSAVMTEPKAYILGKEITTTTIFEIEVEKSLLNERSVVYFGARANGALVIFSDISFGKFCPLERKYESSFIALDGYAISYHENALIIERADKKEIKKRKKALLKEIWKSNGFAERKAIFARALASIYKRLHKKPLWIISDRLGRAGDNGEALFTHLSKTKFKSARFCFAIRKGKDFSRLRKQGRVVDRASLKYKVLFLASDIIISSHAEDFVINPFDYYSRPYKDILCEKKFVFLQHGVTKDDLSAWLNRYNKNIKGFVTSSPLEYASILEGNYHYTESEVWLTGMPRFDSFRDRSERIIAILPTWRRYLAGEIDISNGEWKNSETIKSSRYVEFYSALLNDERLLDALQRYGYKLLLVPHPNMRKICDFIDTPPSVSVQEECEYGELFSKCAMVVTDYSSVVFDMAYLGKPIVYAQFDKDEFFSGAHSYDKGYFDYEKNGFGMVTYTLDETVNAMLQCIENECKCEQKYAGRINEFFAYRDRESCARVIEKIMNLGAKNDKRK